MLFETDMSFLLIKTCITVLLTLCLMFTLTEFKYGQKTVLLIFIGYLGYVIVASWIVIIFFGWHTLIKIFLLYISAPAIFLTYFMAKDNTMQAIFNHLSQINIALFLSVCTVQINTAVNGNQISDIIIRIVLFTVVIVLEYKLIRKPFRELANHVSYNWGSIAIIPVVFCALLLLLGLYPEHYTNDPVEYVYIYIYFYVVDVNNLRSYISELKQCV